MLFPRKTWASRPPTPQVARRWIDRKICFVWLAGNDVELLSGKPRTTDGTSIMGGRYGPAALSVDGKTNVEWSQQFMTTSNGAGTGDFTMMVLASPPTSASGVQHILSQKNDAGGSPFTQAALMAQSGNNAAHLNGSFNFFTYDGTTSNVPVGSALDGEYHLWTGRRRGTAHALFKDDRSIGTATVTARTITQSAARYTAVGSRGNGSTESYNNAAVFAAMFNTALTDAEIAEISRNPWVLFEPVAGGQWFDAVATSGNTISVPAGSLTLTGQTPTVSQTAHQTVAVPAGSLSLTGFAPTVSAGVTTTIDVPAGALSLTGFAPTVSQTANQYLAVDAGNLTLTGYAPDVLGAESTPNITAVGGGKGRREEYHYVVVDGVDYRVSSPEEAESILLQLRELADKRAKRQARRAVVKAPEAPVVQPIRATVKGPDVSTLFAQRLQAQVDAANAQVAEQYARAVKAAQLWQKHNEMLDAEDEEVETLILLGVL